MRGLRVHITGSAELSVDGPLLVVAHGFVSALASRLVHGGAGLVLGVGDEPLGSEGLPCIFDWTVIEAIAAVPMRSLEWPSDRPGRFRVVASQRALERIPGSRRTMWERFHKKARP